MLFYAVLAAGRRPAGRRCGATRRPFDRARQDHGRTSTQIVSDGRLEGRHLDLRRFLRNHYVLDSEVDAVYEMLHAQASTPPTYRADCSVCHQSAADFVRRSLALRDDELVNRATGRPVRAFLHRHRGLQPEQVEFFVRLLTRIAREVFRPEPAGSG